MYCPYCGQLLGEADNFCSSCGRRRPVLLEPLDDVRDIFEGTAPSYAELLAASPAEAAPEVPSAVSAHVDAGASGPGVAGGVPGADGVLPVPGASPHLLVEAPAEPSAPLQATSLDEPAEPDGSEPVSVAPEPAAGAPRAVRRAAPFIAPAVPDPDVPAQASEGTPEPYLPWGSRPTAVFMLVAAVLSALCVVVALVAPVVGFPTVDAAGAASATRSSLQTALASTDAPAAAFVGDLIGSGDSLGVFGALRTATSACDGLDDTSLALAIGLSAGGAAVVALLALAGAASSLALKRATPVLVVSPLLASVLLVSAAGLAAWADGVLVREVRDAVSASFADAGEQLPADLALMQPTVTLVVAAGGFFVAFVLAVLSRHRWVREHPAWKH